MASAGKRLARLLGERSPGIWDTGNTAAWRRGLIDSPYTRLGTRRANEVGGARVEYRQLRVREIERIQLLAKRLSERSGGAISQAQASARLLAAGCALVDCAAEFSDANPARAYYQKLAGHAEPSTKALLVKQKYTYKGNQRPLFTYTLDEKLVDGWSRYQVGTRALGGMETVGGVLGVGAGLGLGGVSCETGVGCVAAAGLMTYSADHAYAGARTLWSGRPTPTLLQDAMVAVGVPLKVVPYLDGALGILTGVGTLSPATLRLPLKEIGAEEISQTGRALVHGEGGTVRAATQDGAARLKAPYPAELKSVGADVTKSGTTVIGRVKDLQNLKKGEQSLLNRLPDRGSAKANWKQNSGVIRQEISKGKPIRDASPGDKRGQFLNAERNLLESRGWTFDKSSSFWNPPKP